MKLIIQIPCFNEENTLPLVLAGVPRSIPGIDEIETLVVDDGSTDRTVQVAQDLGVDHIVRHVGNKGLAAAFKTGLDAALHRGADIIVNTDGDNQYPQEEIPRLIQPILDGRAEVVVGDRQPGKLSHFSRRKKLLLSVGSWIVRVLSGTGVPDAPSGFRAYSRDAALRLKVHGHYTYTLETLIQAGMQQTAIAYVPISVNENIRESRLMSGLWDYVKQSAATIVRTYAMYRPLKVFAYIGLVVSLIGVAGVGRFLYYVATGDGSGHIQSLVMSAAFLIVGFQIVLIGLLADLIAANRRLLEDVLFRVKSIEIQMAKELQDHNARGKNARS
ncbi:MAG: glycosyltransferase family 2 protein [Chloroflexi bacterium]|nr:glycosyltransferase family 2 protein [Chloroflexota bacterium]